MKRSIAVLALWTIALAVVFREVPTPAFSKVAAVFAVCMIGSAWIVRGSAR